MDHPTTPIRSDRQQAVELLAPLSIDEFLHRYWEHRPVVIPGSRAKLERLGLAAMDRNGFVRDAERSTNDAPAGFSIGALRAEWTEAGREQPFVYIDPQAIAGMFADGASIAIDNYGDARLAELVAALKVQLRHAGEVRIDAVLSPPAEGFPIHMDRASVIVVQVEGRKRWRFSAEPALAWPSGTTAFTAAGDVAYRDYAPEPWEEFEQLEIAELCEVVLSPGDVLYIPAGTLHATEALDEPSLSVSMLFSPCRTLDLFGRVLARQLGSDPAWRNVPGVAEPGVLTDEARDFLAARLAELRALVDRLTPEDLAFQSEWQRRLADPGEATNTRLRPGPLADAFEITRATLLRRATRVPITSVEGVEESESWLTAFHRDRELSVRGEWTVFLRNLLTREHFVAGAAVQWSETGALHPWPEVRDSLQALVRDGLLELVNDQPGSDSAAMQASRIAQARSSDIDQPRSTNQPSR